MQLVVALSVVAILQNCGVLQETMLDGIAQVNAASVAKHW